MSKRQKRLHCFRPAQLQDLPRVAYGVWVGSDIRGRAAWPSAAHHPEQRLDPEPVAAIRLQDLLAGVVVQHLTGQRVGDVLGDVVVADAPRVGIAVGTLPDLGRGPLADARESCAAPGPPARPIRSRSAPGPPPATAVRTSVRLRRCSTPAARNRQLGTLAHASGVGGRYIPYAAESGSAAGPGAGSPNSRTRIRQARKASFPVTTCSMQAGASASNTASVRPTRKCP